MQIKTTPQYHPLSVGFEKKVGHLGLSLEEVQLLNGRVEIATLPGRRRGSGQSQEAVALGADGRDVSCK